MVRLLVKFKKIITILLIVALSMNSYAAVVFGDAGANFINKEEFENLKDSFNDQIDDYNRSIDEKIDGAIASYIMQKKDKETVMDIPYKDWKEVKCLNYDLGNSFDAMDFTLTYNWLYWTNVSFNSKNYYQSAWAFADMIKDDGDLRRQVVQLCSAATESEIEPNYVTWAGRATNYVDKLTVSLTYNYKRDITGASPYTNWFYWANNYQFHLTNWTRIKPGYYEVLNDAADTIWQPKIYVKHTTNSSYDWYGDVTTKDGKSAVTQVELREDPTKDNKIKTDEHILHWNNISGIRLADPSWLNHIATNSYITRNNATYDSSKTKNYWSTVSAVHRSPGTGTGTARTTLNGIWRSDYGNDTDSENFVTIGLLQKNYDSNHIYQQEEKVTLTAGETDYKVDRVPLTGGFLCFAGNEEDRFVWEPVFKDTKIGNTINTIADSDFEVNVMLAIVPFKDGNDITDSTKILKNKNQIENYITTKDGKCKFDVEMPEGGVVYCKWWPNVSAFENKYWSATLDLTKCDKYLYITHK